MSEPIKVGDLVYVAIQCPCRGSMGIGRHFIVEKVEPATNFWPCSLFAHSFHDGQPLVYGDAGFGSGYWPAAWVKKVPPLSELEGEQNKEELTA